jgi:hypothetical protein
VAAAKDYEGKVKGKAAELAGVLLKVRGLNLAWFDTCFSRSYSVGLRGQG